VLVWITQRNTRATRVVLAPDGKVWVNTLADTNGCLQLSSGKLQVGARRCGLVGVNVYVQVLLAREQGQTHSRDKQVNEFEFMRIHV
jgi:hypothetical protein